MISTAQYAIYQPLSTYHYFSPIHRTLHIACWKGHESTVLVLLQNRVNPDLQDKVTSRKMMMMSMMIDHDDDNR